jgi:hypothetical protein
VATVVIPLVDAAEADDEWQPVRRRHRIRSLSGQPCRRTGTSRGCGSARGAFLLTCRIRRT